MQRARHQLAIVFGDHQHHPIRQPLAEQLKETAREIGRRPFLVDGAEIKLEEGVPVV